MDSLFSHAPEPEEPAVPAASSDKSSPSIHVVRVPVESDQALEGFMEYIHLWWPSQFTSFGAGTFVSVDMEAIGEEGGPESKWLEWGTVSESLAAHQINIDWLYPSRSSLEFTFVDVSPSGAEVTLKVTGRPALVNREDGSEIIIEWDTILGFYARFMGASPEQHAAE